VKEVEPLVEQLEPLVREEDPLVQTDDPLDRQAQRFVWTNHRLVVKASPL
jgi:hypothetical protein